jgi:mRNA-degrading endonuclease RelE of RelBE toxin-antitoxin system
MSFVVETGRHFEREIKRLKKRYASLPNDFAVLLDQLEAEGTVGIPLGRNCYKIRLAIASKGKGKSGGARVITYVRVLAGVVTLLSIYDKSESDTLRDTERDALLKENGLL